MNLAEKEKRGFVPLLIKAEVSADQVMNGETLWVTTWWQNTGDTPSGRPIQGFVEMQLGHQRILETKDRYYRTYWDPLPATNCWGGGEVWKTTCRVNVSTTWCGTFELYVGLCDDLHTPLQILGESGKAVMQCHIGEIDIGWGWGLPTVEKARKAWSKEINLPRNLAFTRMDSGIAGIIEIEDGIKVRLDGNKPILYGMVDGSEFLEFKGSLPETVLRDRNNDRLIYGSEENVSLDYCCKEHVKDKAVYHCNICCGETYAADFELVFHIIGRKLVITLKDGKDAEGLELLEIKVPSLLSDRRKDAKLVEFYAGGRLVPLDTAAPIGYSHHYDVRNAAALFNSDAILVFESYCLDDRMLVSIQESHEEKSANIGFSLINKVRARGKMASIKVDNVHRIEVDLLDKSWGEPSWKTCAKFLRKDLKGKNRDIYRRALFYKNILTQGPEPPAGRVKEDDPYPVKRLTYVTTLKEALEQVRHFYHIFDGIPQVMYIAGFNKGGFDTNYPYMLETDEKVGTIEDLRNCILEGRKYNAIIGIHDNFDCCVPGEYFDPGIVSMDEEGNLWKDWIWAGGLCYDTGFCKYVKSGLMQERVRKTVELYGLGISSHLDVLSAEPLRYDFDPGCPASAEKSMQGKYAVIEEYNKYGIDITSEYLSHPFVGRIGFTLWLRDDRKDQLFPGEKYIPFGPMVYHGTIGYGGPTGNRVEMLWSLIRGNLHYYEEHHTDPSNIQWSYLQNIPLGLLYDKLMQDVLEEGDIYTVIYDEETHVMVDFDKMEYEIVVDGDLIARNWTSFVPGFRENSYLAYSMDGGRFSYPLPRKWSGINTLAAVTLTLEGVGETLPCEVKNGCVVMDIPKGVPVRVMLENQM